MDSQVTARADLNTADVDAAIEAYRAREHAAARFEEALRSHLRATAPNGAVYAIRPANDAVPHPHYIKLHATQCQVVDRDSAGRPFDTIEVAAYFALSDGLLRSRAQRIVNPA